MSRNPSINVAIASEYTWFHGYARFGIHVSARKGYLEEGYDGWTSGRATDRSGPRDPEALIDWLADTAAPFSESEGGWVAGLGYALLRDVREPAERIMEYETIADWSKILRWRQMLLHRAVTFYGIDSPQYRTLYAHAQGKYDDKEAAVRDVPSRDAMPTWKHIRSRLSMAGKPYEEDHVIWRSVFN